MCKEPELLLEVEGIYVSDELEMLELGFAYGLLETNWKLR